MHEGTPTSTAHGGGHARHALQSASLFGLVETGTPPEALLRAPGL
ncbi:hypothetical protein WME94_35535 [Sorangium sp. So ce429]